VTVEFGFMARSMALVINPNQPFVRSSN